MDTTFTIKEINGKFTLSYNGSGGGRIIRIYNSYDEARIFIEDFWYVTILMQGDK